MDGVFEPKTRIFYCSLGKLIKDCWVNKASRPQQRAMMYSATCRVPLNGRLWFCLFNKGWQINLVPLFVNRAVWRKPKNNDHVTTDYIGSTRRQFVDGLKFLVYFLLVNTAYLRSRSCFTSSNLQAGLLLSMESFSAVHNAIQVRVTRLLRPGEFQPLQ